MEKLHSQSIGLPVITENGQMVGRIFDILVNPDTGKIAGFLVGAVGNKVVSPIDVITWNNSLVIADEEALLDPEDLHAVQQIFKKNLRIVRNKVVTKSGEHLGKVYDAAYNSKMFLLTGILVGKSFMGVYYDRKTVAHKDIIEVTAEKIIVKDPLRLIPVKAKKLSPKLSVDPAPTS